MYCICVTQNFSLLLCPFLDTITNWSNSVSFKPHQNETSWLCTCLTHSTFLSFSKIPAQYWWRTVPTTSSLSLHTNVHFQRPDCSTLRNHTSVKQENKLRCIKEKDVTSDYFSYTFKVLCFTMEHPINITCVWCPESVELIDQVLKERRTETRMSRRQTLDIDGLIDSLSGKKPLLLL